MTLIFFGCIQCCINDMKGREGEGEGQDYVEIFYINTRICSNDGRI